MAEKNNTKSERLNIRLSRKEFRKLEVASEKTGKTKSDILRDCINSAYENAKER